MSWSDVPKKTATEIVNEAAGPAETEENEAGMSTEEKNKRKEAREQMKYDCLCVANNSNETPEQVVERAKAYYSFVTGKGSRKKEG